MWVTGVAGRGWGGGGKGEVRGIEGEEKEMVTSAL